MSLSNLFLPNKETELQFGFFENYAEKLKLALEETDWEKVELLAQTLGNCWKMGRNVFICGNGGSAGNAMHIANDWLYGVSKKLGSGLKIHALSANPCVITCLANDEGYHRIFSHQLEVLGKSGDVLIVLSGSGNSQNILHVLEVAKNMFIETFAILGFCGGKARVLTDNPIVFSTKDMQISEDLQLILCHMVTQWLYNNQMNFS